MRDKDRSDKQRMMQALGGHALLFVFGLGVLGFLVAVDRADWRSMRPAIGTSIVVARVADPGPAANEDGSSTVTP